MAVIETDHENHLDQPKDFAHRHLPFKGPALLELREVHQDNPKMTGILDIVLNVCLDIELDRSVLLVDQAEEVAFHSADLIGPDRASLSQINLASLFRDNADAAIVPERSHPLSVDQKVLGNTQRIGNPR
ncbi:hypothetical protein [Aureimonas sp. AU12]|uniref:hypothetical protein n=1 Tax=Aureimonas sp. AU12 TaxID=1638161 RepID=UPI0012E3A472|nr:hypothetical protein [Aureimonas sp. AU12]